MALNFVQIGKHICELRKHRGITQQHLAELVDKSPAYISYIESGFKGMSLDTFVLIANALHVSADELLADAIDNTLRLSNHAFTDLVSDCSEYETYILLTTAKAVKASIRDNKHSPHRHR